MPIPLRTAAFWTVYKLLERAPVMQQPVEKVRAASELRRRLLRLAPAGLFVGRALPPAALSAGRAPPRTEASEIAAPAADGTPLLLRVHRPLGAGGHRLPVVLNFHGGGWVSGDVRQSEWWASSVAAEAGVCVVSVEYRVAPEHPFPGPPEDCYDATLWVAEHADELQVDASRLALMGDSAGGNLAAVVAMMARDRARPEVAAQ